DSSKVTALHALGRQFESAAVKQGGQIGECFESGRRRHVSRSRLAEGPGRALHGDGGSRQHTPIGSPSVTLPHGQLLQQLLGYTVHVCPEATQTAHLADEQ
ncbi:MAG TPA: hypothetical protein VGJ84_01185, partial [Polyangiaceae bacterium]